MVCLKAAAPSSPSLSSSYIAALLGAQCRLPSLSMALTLSLWANACSREVGVASWTCCPSMAIMVPDTTLGPGTGISRWKACSQSFPCAGRALRNAFLATSPQPAKDQIQLARIIRRSYVGLELVEWILKQCLFIQCRVVAAGVWQILLELGILFSVDQSNVFEDANSYYQFSYEECDIKDCHFRNEQEWHSGVQLLMQLVPYVQFRIAVIDQ
ncbi:RPGF5 factor, partial [Polyodon spathula]|nr:RPGF5 factor [Polyodon spathula]